jgi:hypothetical protein
MQTISLSVDRASMRTRPARSRFYVAIGTFMCGIVLIGFWPTYFGPALRGEIARPAVIQVHGQIGATVALLFAAVGRISFISSLLVSEVVWLSPMLVAMADDWKHRGRPHPASVIATAWLLVGSARGWFIESETWLPIGRAILGSF